MNCNEIRELISSMLDHELSAEDSAIVAEHLADCPECMRVFEAFHAISVSLEELEDVPEGFTEAVMHKINTPAPVKKRRPAYLRIAGLAACLALVLFTGSRITTSHLHSGDRNIQDTAQYARVTHQTPKPTPTPTPVVTADLSGEYSDETATVADHQTLINDGESEAEKTVNDVSPEPTVAPTPDNTPFAVVTPTEEPVPTATPQPTPVAGPAALNTFIDLLYAAETADFALFTDNPDYELTVQDEAGNNVKLLIWLDGERIYCKNLVEGTAWYAVGTAETLTAMINETRPVSTPVPSPTAS